MVGQVVEDRDWGKTKLLNVLYTYFGWIFKGNGWFYSRLFIRWLLFNTYLIILKIEMNMDLDQMSNTKKISNHSAYHLECLLVTQEQRDRIRDVLASIARKRKINRVSIFQQLKHWTNITANLLIELIYYLIVTWFS